MSLSSVAKGAVAQINPFDNGATYGTYNNGFSAKPPVTAAPVKTPSYTPSTTYSPDTSGLDAQIASSNAAIKALQAQISAQPKLPYYNTSAAWATAQAKAESNINPVYVDKLNSYLEKKNLERNQQQDLTNRNISGIATDLSQTNEDIGTARTRANEDTTTSLDDLNAQEAYAQETGGTAFDRARTALLGSVANAGLTTSGLGAQQEQNAIDDRNVAEAEGTRQNDVQKKAATTLQTRTMADLDTKGTRAEGSAQTKTEGEQINLRNFIDNQDLAEKDFRTSNEADRLGAISGETKNQYTVGVRDFINSLVGGGARAQDIALAQQVYS